MAGGKKGLAYLFLALHCCQLTLQSNVTLGQENGAQRLEDPSKARSELVDLTIEPRMANKKASKGPADLAGLAGRQLGSSSKRTRQQAPSKPSPFKIDPGFYGYHGGDDYGEGPVLSAEYANSVEVSDGDRNSHSSRYPYRYSNPKSSNKRFGSSGRPEFSYDYGDYYDGEGTRKFNAPNHQERDPQYHGLHEDGDDDNQRLHGPDRYNDDLPWESHSDRKGGSGGFRPLARPLDATDDDSEQDKNKNDEGLSIMEMPKMDKFFPIDKSSFIKETSDFAKSHLQEISENFESQLDLGKGQGHGSGSEYDGGETYGHHGGEGVQYEGDYRGYHVGSNGEHEEYHGGYHAFEESDYGLDIGYGGALGSHYSSHGAGARGDRFEQPIFKDTPIYRPRSLTKENNNRINRSRGKDQPKSKPNFIGKFQRSSPQAKGSPSPSPPPPASKYPRNAL